MSDKSSRTSTSSAAAWREDATEKRLPGPGAGELLTVLASGLLIGGLGVVLSLLGNPRNSGICVSCFLENIAGSLGFHQDQRMMYLRPEVMGFLLGAFLIALARRDFRVRGGSSPMVRFFGGFFLIVGCAVFIGCPIKMVLRLGAGDLTAAVGAAGLVAGVLTGIGYLRRGFYLGHADSRPVFSGLLMPAAMLLLLAALALPPAFVAFSSSGPGALHPAWYWSLGAGLIIGAAAQRSRFCVTGGLRNLFLTRDLSSGLGLLGLVLSAGALAWASGQFHLGLEDQPGSHPDNIWNFLGLYLVGFAAVLVDGCPFRQLILAGEGSTDAGLAIMGMLLGGGAVYAWGIRSTAAGPTVYGQAAVLAGLIFCFAAANACRRRG